MIIFLFILAGLSLAVMLWSIGWAINGDRPVRALLVFAASFVLATLSGATACSTVFS